MSKEKVHPYRGLKKRLERKNRHVNRNERERLLFVLKMEKRINIWAKDVKDNKTPTNYFVVEFQLKDPLTLSDFETLLYQEMGIYI